MFDLEKIGEKRPVREKVKALEDMLSKFPQADVPEHFIAGGGIAAKTVFFKAGTFVVGGMHRFENMSYMPKGDILIMTDGDPVRYIAYDQPCIMVAPAGAKRAAYVVQDTYWTSLQATDLTTLEDVEKHFIVPPEEQEAFLLALESKTIMLEE